MKDDALKNILGILGSKKFGNLKDNLENIISETDFTPVNAEELYSLLIEDYLKLIKKLKIGKFLTFSFADYEDSRVVVIDGRKYDFDAVFSHNNSAVSECLCEIDALISDLGQGAEKVLREIEKRINNTL